MLNFASAIPSRADLEWCWYLRRNGIVGEALERVLHDIGVMQPGDWSDWHPSSMTHTGAPVEMIFNSNQSGLSLRTEVDDPAKDPAGRLATACALITTLGGTPPSSALRDVIGACQSTSALRFGAWLGLHRCDKQLAISVMAEIPATAFDLAGLLSSGPIQPVLDRLGDSTRTSMLGYDTQNGRVTLYCQTDSLLDNALPLLAKAAQVPPQPLLQGITRLNRQAVRQKDRPEKWGFSLTFGNRDTPPTLKLQLAANALFANDAQIAGNVTAILGSRHATYNALIDPLAPEPCGRMRHGQIELLARRNQNPLIYLNVAAPWVCHFDTV